MIITVGLVTFYLYLNWRKGKQANEVEVSTTKTLDGDDDDKPAFPTAIKLEANFEVVEVKVDEDDDEEIKLVALFDEQIEKFEPLEFEYPKKLDGPSTRTRSKALKKTAEFGY